MPRVRWCPLLILCLINIWILVVNADCWYENQRHEDGAEVATAEPCLNCTCNRGALLCYLRVCPRLPNPPPPGCILLHRYRTCCPELICSALGGNGLEARSEPEDLDIYDKKLLGNNACFSNGSIYGPGSAMDSSSLCEYCYCLRGKQTCVKPKCLLPIEGCIPMYEPTNCCPVHYQCQNNSTTTPRSVPSHNDEKGCTVNNIFYKEGQKVLGVGHSVCDNCYCLRGVLRCEPLSCAPPLLGCTPIIKDGECCAASYNCSGTIEIRPEPNYGHYPIVSKEYAKLRKEVYKPPPKKNEPFYVIAESKPQRTTNTFGTTRHFNGAFNPSTTKPFYYDTLDENLSTSESKTINKFPYYATTNYEFHNANFKRVYSTTTKPKDLTTTKSMDYLKLSDDALLSIVDSLLDGHFYRDVETKEDDETTTTTATTESTTEITSTTDASTTTTEEATTDSLPITIRSLLNSTDCFNSSNPILPETPETPETTLPPINANEINKLAEVKNFEELLTTLEDTETTTLTTTTETKVILPKIAPDIESILNISKTKEVDYEYDYNEPSLPPSLPNLKIIPFVAADALDSKKDLDNVVYPQERITNYGNTNLFSPPEKTEGGFIPKQPLILDNFYENAVTAVPVTTPKTSQMNCFSNGREVVHGESVTSDSACVTCTCFYGNVICQKATCIIPIGCRKSTMQDLTLCCPHYVCNDDEAPTVVLDRVEATNQKDLITVADGLNTPDPFRDVIRTEPAPDLQSLIVDMMPFLARKTSPLTTPKTTTTVTTTTKPQMNQQEDTFSLDKVIQLLLNSERAKTTTTTTTTESTTKNDLESQNDENKVDSSQSVGILKLAGCNIYGRMYRVGRIISELSNPCLECKCTEIGVQCRDLKC